MKNSEKRQKELQVMGERGSQKGFAKGKSIG
jgi:hypothetical protein